ncbi:MAG TPA: GAF domain-containing protein [Elusimicrobiales bacterium]|nr:GAF domain-containing protein [Elusimicrobiales bacterium]
MTRAEDLEKRLELLVKFGGSIGTETHIHKLIELIADQVKTILACDRCTVFVIDRHTNELWSQVAQGMQHTEIRIPYGRGIAGHVAATGQVMNITDAYGDAHFNQDTDRLTGYRTHTILAVPLRNINGRTIGVFEVINKAAGTFNKDDEGILQLLGSIASSAIENAQLYESLSKSQLETIYRLAVTAEYRDQQDTAIHLRHISEYSALLAESVGLPQKEIENIRYASPLHDIGKVGIADAILLKPGKLTADEFEEMKKHTLYGAKILCNAESTLLQIACKIAGSHHEKFDGTGYPARLRGEQIPIYARIVSVVDVFDALCMPRVYKPKWEPERALEYIRNESGKAFDPMVVDAFERVYDQVVKIYSLSDARTTVIPGITREIHKHDY